MNWDKPKESEKENLKRNIREIFLNSLEAVKEAQPNTPEWDLFWGSLLCYKNYLERQQEKGEACK